MNEWWGYGWQDARQGWVEWGGAWQKYCRASCLMIFSFGWLFCSLFLFWSLLGVRPLPCKRLTLEKLVAWGTSPPRSTCKAIVYLWRRYHRNPGTVVLFPVATFSCQRRTPSPPLARPTTQSLDRSVARCRNCGPATACVARFRRKDCFTAFVIPPTTSYLLVDVWQTTNLSADGGRWPAASDWKEISARALNSWLWSGGAYTPRRCSVTRGRSPLTRRLTHGHWTRDWTPKLPLLLLLLLLLPPTLTHRCPTLAPQVSSRRLYEVVDGECGLWGVLIVGGVLCPSIARSCEFNKLEAAAAPSLPLARLRKEERESI